MPETGGGDAREGLIATVDDCLSFLDCLLEDGGLSTDLEDGRVGVREDRSSLGTLGVEGIGKVLLVEALCIIVCMFLCL